MSNLISIYDKQYDNCHKVEGCPGQFRYIERRNIHYFISPSLLVHIPVAPFIACSECEAAFFPDGFMEKMEQQKLSEILSREDAAVNRAELRFMRTLLGLTQKDAASCLGVSIFVYKAAEMSGEPTFTAKQIRDSFPWKDQAK